MGLFCVIFLIIIVFLFQIASIQADKRQSTIFKQPFAVLGIILFSLLVGLRYNPVVDLDFMNYWWVAQYGSKFYEYDRFEFFPRLLADIVRYFEFSPSAWFIMMGALLISFTAFAAERISRKFVPYTIAGLFLLFLSFDMNVMRQGLALSVFLCAITYIDERRWAKFVFFMLIAYGFHRSSIIWCPIYLFAYVDWSKKTIVKFVLIAIGMVSVFSLLSYVVENIGFVFRLINMESKLEDFENISSINFEEKGSGIGVVLRYVRWMFLVIYIPRIASLHIDSQRLRIIFSLFIIGAVSDFFAMYSVYLSRVGIYPQITELLLYPYLIDYMKRYNKSISLLWINYVLQVSFLLLALYLYLDKWNLLINFL